MEVVTRCLLCGSRDFSTILDGVTDVHHAVEGRWRLLRCVGCGLGATDPRPTPEEIPSLYPEDYAPFQKSEEAGIDQATWKRRLTSLPGLRQLHALLWDSRDFWIPDLPADSRVLDLGCGTGAFLQAMRPRGWLMQGLEPSPQAATAARVRGLDVHVGTLESARYPDARFQAVFAHHVLEHVVDPVATAREVHRILLPRGYFLVVVPNVESLWFRVFGADWFPLEIPRHIHHFSPATLRLVAERSGFEVLGVRHARRLVTLQASAAQWARGRFLRRGLAEMIETVPLTWWSRLLFLPFERVPSMLRRSDVIAVGLRKADPDCREPTATG